MNQIEIVLAKLHPKLEVREVPETELSSLLSPALTNLGYKEYRIANPVTHTHSTYIAIPENVDFVSLVLEIVGTVHIAELSSINAEGYRIFFLPPDCYNASTVKESAGNTTYAGSIKDIVKIIAQNRPALVESEVKELIAISPQQNLIIRLL
jgi:hypothetical protein